MEYINAYSIAGGITGFVVGLTGIGAGALMTPILLIFFGLSPTTAVATDLWFATFTKIAALISHQKANQVDWHITRRLWAGSLPTAAFVVLTIVVSTQHGFTFHILTSIIGLVILVTSIGMIFSPQITNRLSHVKTYSATLFKPFQSVGTIVAGVVLGLVVTLTSVGAGVIGSVLLLFLYPVRLTTAKLVGTEIAHAIPLALIGGAGYLFGGYVDQHILISLLIGSIPAALLGSMVSTRISHGQLRIGLAMILSFSGVKLLLG